MHYKVLQDSKIAGENWKAYNVSKGEIVEINNKQYANSLIDAGIVEPEENKNRGKTFETPENPTGDDLGEIGGVGPATKKKLNQGGYFTFKSIAETSTEKLSDDICVSEYMARRLIDECNKRLRNA